MDIKLILPTPEYEQQVMALRAELFTLRPRIPINEEVRHVG
jgi:hypothetical protein